MRKATASVYRYVLDVIPQLGRIPTLVEVQRDLSLEAGVVTDSLRELAAIGTLRLDPASGWISEIYPYSASDTKHSVVFKSGVRVHCMCAIDCFYVPFLTDADITIHSSCHLCQHAIEVRIEGQRPSTVTPSSAVVWDSDASYDCPKTNFFCCDAHLQDWKQRESNEPGALRLIDEALERGRAAVAQIRRAVREVLST